MIFLNVIANNLSIFNFLVYIKIDNINRDIKYIFLNVIAVLIMWIRISIRINSEVFVYQNNIIVRIEIIFFFNIIYILHKIKIIIKLKKLSHFHANYGDSVLLPQYPIIF